MSGHGAQHVREMVGYFPHLLFAVLVIAVYAIWSSVFAFEASGQLRVSFFDVGQGDAAFIVSPDGTQVLIDGGQGRAVLRAIGREIPFTDRTIDMVLATHPDLDHIGGLPEIFSRYAIGMFIGSGVADDGADHAALMHAVRSEAIPAIVISERTVLDIGGGAVLEVLFPDRDASGLETNMGGLVVRIAYGETSFLFMGDTPVAIEGYLAGVYGDALKSTVLKLGHHGSRTSTSDALLGFAAPDFAVISAGCDNSYGHPHTEVLERLSRFGIEPLNTCVDGTITFQSDGMSVELLR